MAEFDFKKQQDRYFITSQEIETVNYEIKKLSNCVDYTTVGIGTIDPGMTEEILLVDDGEYIITINDEDSIFIKHYLRLQTSIIEGILNNICDCECGCECSEEEDTLCNLLMLRAKIDVYKRLINPQGVAFFDAVNQYTKCLVVKPIYCTVNTEMILGESECDIEIVKQLMALDYLGIYFFELAQTSTDEDKEYVREKFNTNTIFCCIKSLGINVGEIETLINENMGLLTFNSGAYVNQPPSAVGDHAISVANRATTVLTLDMFTTLTVPAYADPEGDAPAAVRIDTVPVNGELKLSGVTVIDGQVILVADINAGNLTFESPDQDGLDGSGAVFSVSDTGSGLFVS